MKLYGRIAGAVIALMLLAGCTPAPGAQNVVSNEPTQSVQPASEASVQEPESAAPENEVKTINVGETIVTETREITLGHVEFSYDVEPEEKNVVYTHYAAESGKVYIDIAVAVKNIQKQQLKCTEVMSASADYDNGYTYSGSAIVEDATLGFAMAITKNIDPLDTVKMHYLIECPQEVEENTDAPVFVVLTVEGVKYQYNIR